MLDINSETSIELPEKLEDDIVSKDPKNAKDSYSQHGPPKPEIFQE